MNPLRCLQPEWVPSSLRADFWEKDIFPDTEESLANPDMLKPLMWVNHESRSLVTVAPDRLVLSCWHPLRDEGIEEIIRFGVQKTFIGAERPQWIWRQGGDVAKEGWERAGKRGSQPKPVYAWHLTDPNKELT